jgi:hypothetical protein
MYQYEGYPSVDMGDGYFVYGELPALVENNPDWFQEVVEPERVEINSLKIHDNFLGNKADTYWYQFCANQPLDETKFPAITQAIEAISSNIEFHNFPGFQRVYTEADLDKARREGVSNGETMYSLEDVRKALHGEWGTGNAVENVLNRLRNYKK